MDPSPNSFFDSLRTEFRSRAPREILRLEPSVLLGVSPDAVAALATLEIASVFDLAASGVFRAAAEIVGANGSADTAIGQYGAPPTDLVVATAENYQLGELATMPIGVLRAVPPGQQATLEAAFGVSDVRELSLYPPYLTAVAILNSVFFPENVPGFDAERPADLVPKSGEYPTERVQYSTLVMESIPRPVKGLTEVMGPAFQPPDLTALGQGESGYTTVATGALLTFTQSWFAQAVTLGQLLHSTALAPGGEHAYRGGGLGTQIIRGSDGCHPRIGRSRQRHVTQPRDLGGDVGGRRRGAGRILRVEH